MKSFVSLVKKEWRIFGLWWILSMLFGFIFIGLLPPIMEHFLNKEISSEEMRIVIIFISKFLLILIPIIQFHSSLHQDIKQKDIWLHNPNSIFTLIGAKWIFVLIALIVTSIFFFLGFFFLGDNLIGTWKQIILLILVLTGVEIFCYVTFSNLFLLLFAFYLQGKRYIGQFSLLISITLTILFFWFISVVPEKYIQIPYGKIPTDWIHNNLPTFNNSKIFVDLELYSVDLIVSLLFLTICFIAASKWIEKVITR